jgi:hypothetical protein
MEDSNTPVILKAQAAIDDHLKWAEVHKRDLIKVQAEISNTNFAERCADTIGELISALPQFSKLCPRYKRFGSKLLEMPITTFADLDLTLVRPQFHLERFD